MEGELEKKVKPPWEMEKNSIIILKKYSAEIIGEDGKEYEIEFYDDKQNCWVEADISKEKFEVLPYEAKINSLFWIVCYKVNDSEKIKVSVWPISKFWHKSWLE